MAEGDFFTLKREVEDIAEYLGCNGGELWSEIETLFKQSDAKAYNKGWSAGYKEATRDLRNDLPDTTTRGNDLELKDV